MCGAPAPLSPLATVDRKAAIPDGWPRLQNFRAEAEEGKTLSMNKPPPSLTKLTRRTFPVNPGLQSRWFAHGDHKCCGGIWEL